MSSNPTAGDQPAFKPGDKVILKERLTWSADYGTVFILEPGTELDLVARADFGGGGNYVHFKYPGAPHQILTTHSRRVDFAPDASRTLRVEKPLHEREYKEGDRIRVLEHCGHWTLNNDEPYFVNPGDVLTVHGYRPQESDFVAFSHPLSLSGGGWLLILKSKIEPCSCTCSWDRLWNNAGQCVCSS